VSFPAASPQPYRAGAFRVTWRLGYETQGHRSDGAFATVCIAPPKLAGLRGRYVLRSIGGQPLPAWGYGGWWVSGDTITFHDDSTETTVFVAGWTMRPAETIQGTVAYAVLNRRYVSASTIPGYSGVVGLYDDSTLFLPDTAGWVFRKVRVAGVRP
jgi:hypothetical protein